MEPLQKNYLFESNDKRCLTKCDKVEILKNFKSKQSCLGRINRKLQVS